MANLDNGAAAERRSKTWAGGLRRAALLLGLGMAAVTLLALWALYLEAADCGIMPEAVASGGPKRLRDAKPLGEPGSSLAVPSNPNSRLGRSKRGRLRKQPLG